MGREGKGKGINLLRGLTKRETRLKMSSPDAGIACREKKTEEFCGNVR